MSWLECFVLLYARVSLSCSFSFFSVARTLNRSFVLLEVVSAFILSGIQDFEDSLSVYVKICIEDYRQCKFCFVEVISVASWTTKFLISAARFWYLCMWFCDLFIVYSEFCQIYSTIYYFELFQLDMFYYCRIRMVQNSGSLQAPPSYMHENK